MYYCNIKKSDIADGPGVRVTLFVSGCTHHCEECFQPETWNFSYGQPFTKDVEEELMDALQPGYVSGLTLLGGEPFEPEHQYVLLPFLQRVRRELPKKTIWAYSGYVYEELTGNTNTRVVVKEFLSFWKLYSHSSDHIDTFTRHHVSQ